MKQPDESVMPQIIKDAIIADQKPEILSRAFEYSATVLCKSPRQVQLERRHKDEIESSPIISRWYSFLGDAIHGHIENCLKGNDRYIVERRIINFDKPLNGEDKDLRRVGAKFDAYDKETKTLYDHKTTTTYIFGKEMKLEWMQQLMINAYFLEKEGYPVEKVSINAIYVDWRDQRYKYSAEGSYPSAPSTSFEMPVWSMEDREFLYKSLLKAHIEAEEIPDEELPYCSKEYCWQTDGKVAVYKEGGAKAIRLLNTIEQATEYINFKNIRDAKIEYRKASRKRCEQYCECAPFCNQYQDWLKSQVNLHNLNPVNTQAETDTNSGTDCSTEKNHES